MLVAGVDVSGAPGAKNFSYVAWLDIHTKVFELDAYAPAPSAPLPVRRDGATAAFIGFDCPQSLPVPGKARRKCDAEAKTATAVIPDSRETLQHATAYKGLIETGIDIFWNSLQLRTAVVYGLPQAAGGERLPVIFETYPRYTIRQWLRRMLEARGAGLLYRDSITHKNANPMRYVDYVWDGLRLLGYDCPGVARPSVDQADAMLCAAAARELCLAAGGALPNTVGEAPYVDAEGRVLREGYIVCP